MSERFDYRVHWLTAVAQLIVGGALVYWQMEYILVFSGGWPLRVDDRPWAPMVNLVSAIAVIGSTSFVMERWLQAHRRRWELRLSFLLALVGVLAALLAIWRAFPQLILPSHYFVPNFVPTPLHRWVFRMPIIFGLGCTIYTAGWLAVQAISRAAALIRCNGKRIV